MPSIYERCNATAAAHKAAQWAAYRAETWWQDRDIWLEHGINQSSTERLAYEAILETCGHLPVNRHEDLLALVRECLSELRQESAGKLIPLKDVLAARGETLYWREPGLRPAAYVVPIVAVGS